MFDNYVGQLLISMPNLNDPFFKKTVILICEFNEKSVLGLILNKPIVDIKFDSLLKNLKIFGDNKLIDHQIYIGGPVYTNQGFIIHSTDKEYEDTQIISNDLRKSGPKKDIPKTLMLIRSSTKKRRLNQKKPRIERTIVIILGYKFPS